MAADGRKLDVGATENAILAQYGLPDSIDPEMRTPHAYHTFSPQYASNLYTYLWSDAAAADIAEVFLRAPDQFFDKTIGASYNSLILGRGHRVPIDQAYREFHGRSIDPSALMRRFGLAVE
jgi:peptidyl-dipeptidase Dcp